MSERWLSQVKSVAKGGVEACEPCFRLYGQFTGEDYFLITGIPRSGTSLFCKVASAAPECICFNEVHPAYRLNASLWLARRKLGMGWPVTNKFDESGQMASDTNRQEARLDRQPIDTQVEAGRLVIGTKFTVPYLNHLDTLIESGYPIFALMRDPRYTLLSWNSREVASIPEARLEPEHLDTRYGAVSFVSSNRLEMQAQIWEHYADLIWRSRSALDIVCYETLTERTEDTLEWFARRMNLDFDAMPDLENRNDLDRYDNADQFDEIGRVVDRFCPSRRHFGYA